MDEFENCLNRLKGYFDDLKEYEGSKLVSKKDFYAASMVSFSIINDCLRLAERYMSMNAMPAPLSYKDMLDILGKENVISGGLALRMKFLVSKRNLIAHEYGELKREDVSGLISGIGAAREFASAISKAHSKKGAK